MYFDPLERRVLFAGVTILTHGLNGNIDGWIAGAADAIQTRAGGMAAASQYVMKLDKSGGSIVVKSITLAQNNLPLQQTTAGEAIIKLDWSKISGADQNTGPVAQAVVDYLTAHHDGVPDFVDLPIHLVGHSKGGSLVSEISAGLGKRGVWVDQMTGLDPVGGTVVDIPFVGKQTFGDPEMASYDNVIFVDDYYRTGMQPAGQSFSGAHVANLSSIVTDSYLYGAHNGVTVYYDGTIDVTLKSAGGMPIESSWYGKNADKPGRDQTGYLFSRLGAGARPSDGLAVAFGGKASRKSAGQSGSQFANVFGPSITGGNVISNGQTLTLTALYGDRDGGATITFFLDGDRNPFNGTGSNLGSKSVGKTGDPASVSVAGSTSGITGGTYYLGASITDADGHVRYVYNNNVSAVTVGTADFASMDEDGVVNVAGTSGNDLFAIKKNTIDGNDVLQIIRNGVTQNFDFADVVRINLDAGDGNDTLTADAFTPAMYAYGGAGNDSLSTGGGNDTLTGGAGKNTLMGNDGDDRVNGSGGRDVLFGGAGTDRMYGNGSNDTLDGGGGVDRIWGGDGDDVLTGGSSNDKLYGGAGADSMNGNKGNDLFGDRDEFDTIIKDVGDSIVDALG